VKVVVHVVGARPNFVKMAPVIAALKGHSGIAQRIVHTGQHYDEELSSEVLADLCFPAPDAFLGIGSGTHGAQTARALESVERVLMQERPALVCVGGDVNSTLAGALAAVKLGIPVAHIEAGLRSFDWTMPEEVNRVVTDRLSTVLFTHSPECDGNLRAEGIDATQVHAVGNTMIDSLRRFEHQAEARRPWTRMGLPRGSYVLVTLHRPSNVDDRERLRQLVAGLAELNAVAPVLFPAHPRTRSRLDECGLMAELTRSGVRCSDATSYLDFLGLEMGAGAIVTDSGGVQEEASALGVPCYTLRRNTERPVTITHGTNTLLWDDPAAIAGIRLDRAVRRPITIEGWDGQAGTRAARRLAAFLASEPAEVLATGGWFRRPPAATRDTRAEVLGCEIDRIDMDEALTRCDAYVRGRAHARHIAVNAAKIVSSRHSLEVRRLINGADLVTADGQAVVWASRLLGDPLPARVTGIDLMERLLALADGRGYRVFLLGARPEVLSVAVARIQARHPGLTIAGHRDGYFTRAEEPEVAGQIRAARPDLLFVAMSSPQKEYFLGRWASQLDVPFSMGVGGALDVIAGQTRRAPHLVQRLGLEWAFRLAQEPRRLGRRYLTTNSTFVWLTVRGVAYQRREAHRRTIERVGV
jgi:UDP-N-acetylglucosamine 2-epimerase (non-hydrolysing)